MKYFARTHPTHGHGIFGGFGGWVSKDRVAMLVDSICVLGDVSAGYEKVL